MCVMRLFAAQVFGFALLCVLLFKDQADAPWSRLRFVRRATVLPDPILRQRLTISFGMDGLATSRTGPRGAPDRRPHSLAALAETAPPDDTRRVWTADAWTRVEAMNGSRGR